MIFSRENSLSRRISVIGGITGILASLVFRRWLSAEFQMLREFGLFSFSFDAESSGISDWFNLLHENSFVGMLLLNAFDMINYILVVILIIAACYIMMKDNRRFAGVAVVLSLVGLCLYLSGSQAFNMLELSRQYQVASTPEQSAGLLAAGQLALVINNPLVFGNGMFWSYICLYSAELLLGILMLKTGAFGRLIPVLGLIASICGLGYFPTAAFFPELSILPAVSSAPFHMVWYLLTGIKLIRDDKN